MKGIDARYDGQHTSRNGNAVADGVLTTAPTPAPTPAPVRDDKGKDVSSDTDSDDDRLQVDHHNVDLENGDGNYDAGDSNANPRLLQATGGPRSPTSASDTDDDNGSGKCTPVRNRGRTVKRKPKNEKPTKQETVRWRDLPEKGQLTVLTFARLSEPLVQTSLQSYMFYQLQSFRPDLPPSVIASQSGILHASFTAAQFLTAMVWGRLADSHLFGRKKVLMIGLAGTMLSCLGFGFSQSFWQALFFRSLGGATNGNVGVLRTMYQSRAFLILPMTFNIGVIIGPILGGVLSDPAHSYPNQFGDNAFFLRFPYAAPNLLSAVILFSALLGVWLGLEETLDSRRGTRDLGIELRRKIVLLFRRSPDSIAYTPLATHSRNVSDASTVSFEMDPVTPVVSTEEEASTSATAKSSQKSKRPRTRYSQRLPFRRIFTKNVILTLLAQSIFAFHMGSFNSLWFVFLSTPVYDPTQAPAPKSPAAKAAHYLTQNLPFVFTGGIGLPPREVGMAMAILGCFGITMQLLLYPSVSARLGVVRSWRIFLCCFPVTYFIVPFLSLVPSLSAPPHAKDGAAIWFAIALVLLCHVTGRTFALPAQTILVNNCTPHPSVLGSLHGLAQSTSSLARTVGPILSGYLYGLGLNHGLVGAVFWGLSSVAIIGLIASMFVREGDGHEIWLEGDVEDED
ncbi:MFS transporter [Sporothrix schenckii 1099-18]|uniref:MFS transporter n=1 Tax=Sporothrix schenckii 1099-18 TaxID=1397361 RepID=A0A0F2MC85_SPOSC|nr:MFS transporter [Sporothrix schenckii 1099-18]KJR86684.1 MFS transporter [Sporothrix schenckii 1099-18]